MERPQLVAWLWALGVLLVPARETLGAEGVQKARFLPDVVAQFNSLSERPESMGFELNGPDASACRHLQAVTRTEAADGTPYLLVSRSGILPPVTDCPYQIGGDGNPTSNLYVVRMGSRDKTGERLRSNRLRPDLTSTQTPPEAQDTVVKSIPFDEPLNADGTLPLWPKYGHPAGMQQVGNIVGLALQNNGDRLFPPPPFVSGLPKTMIQFLDVSDPESPRVSSQFPLEDEVEQAGVLGLTPCGADRIGVPCATGHYLMVTTGGDNRVLRFYESSSTPGCGRTACDDGTDLGSPDLTWTLLDTWTADHGFDCTPLGQCTPRLSDDEIRLGENWHNDHQTLQFLREGDLRGALYLAGARGHFLGDDFMDLYRVELEGSEVRLTHVSTRHKVSHPAGEGENAGARIANFGAGTGFHVTPSGELLFYATEHDNDGPEGTNGRASVKMGEWRHIDLVRRNSPTLFPSLTLPEAFSVPEGGTVLLQGSGQPPLAKAWIQLYADRNYTGRDLLVEYPDRPKDNFDDFRRLDPGFVGDVDGFSDEASSWRWFAPQGCTIRVNDDDFGDSDFPGQGTRTLAGTGVRMRAPDLNDVRNDTDTGNVDDSFTSVQFLPDCDTYYKTPVGLAWDLDRNGSFETAGSPVTFSARGLDGPRRVEVPVRAQSPLGGRAGTSVAIVEVVNVAPTIGAWRAFDRTGQEIGTRVPAVLAGSPVFVAGTFTDPGRRDHQSATVDWGDGTTDTRFLRFRDAFRGRRGQLIDGHVYRTPGNHDVVLEITDDDGGTTRAVVHVAVVAAGASSPGGKKP